MWIFSCYGSWRKVLAQLLLWLSSQANATSVRVRLFSAVWITCNLTFVVTKTPFLFDNAAEICVKLYLFSKGYILLRPPTFCFYFLWGGLSFNYGVQTPQTPHNSHPVGWQRSGLGRWHSTRVATKMNTHVAFGAGTQLHRPLHQDIGI